MHSLVDVTTPHRPKEIDNQMIAKLIIFASLGKEKHGVTKGG